MKDFKDMTFEELDNARTELFKYLDKARQQKKQAAYERAEELVNELNSITRKWNIELETIGYNGLKMELIEEIEVVKPDDCD